MITSLLDKEDFYFGKNRNLSHFDVHNPFVLCLLKDKKVSDIRFDEYCKAFLL